jgi:uncharacterized protein YnzC (UPF0291/DUF896 family)
MEQEKILRISELTRLSRQRPLTEEEQAERAALRREYLDGFRANVEATLQSVSICEADGSIRPLQKMPVPPDQ